MKNQEPFQTFLFLSTLLLLFISSAKGKCPPSFLCGNLGTMFFPYTDTKHPHCGLLVMHGCDDRDPDAIKTVKNKGEWFFITRDPNTNNLVFRDDQLRTFLLTRTCGVFCKNYTSLDTPSLFLSLHFKTATFFICNRTLNINPPSSVFYKSTICPDEDIFYGTSNVDESFSYYSEELHGSYFEQCSWQH